MKRTLTLLVFVGLLSSCAEIHPYHCPPINERHKMMSHQDMKYLERKHHPFKKPIPEAEKRESYSGNKDHLHRSRINY